MVGNLKPHMTSRGKELARVRGVCQKDRKERQTKINKLFYSQLCSIYPLYVDLFGCLPLWLTRRFLHLSNVLG